MANSSPADAQFLERLHRVIQDKMTDSQFGVSELAREMGMSRSNLHRRVREITGKTVISLISEARLKRALELLKEGVYTVSEVSWSAGFGSVTYFNKCFHDFYGFPPGEARNKDLSKIPESGKPNEDVIDKFRKKRNVILFGVLSTILLSAVIVILILVKPFKGDRKEIEKSIAVLPFINDSPDTTNVYFINGIMDGILTNLQKIKELKVLSRTSVEKYRYNKNKTIPEIAKELGVSYIVEGSGQKYGDQVMLSIQLIEAQSDKYLLSEPYKREVKKVEDIFSLMSEIATLVATKIEATITPEEKELIEKKPTENISALNMSLRGSELTRIAGFGNKGVLLNQAMDFYKKAIQLDTTYADPYIQLGWVVLNTSRNLDSALYLANQALHFDEKNSGAYGLKSWVYTHLGLYNEAEDACKLAIKYDPNKESGFHFMADLLFINGEYFQSIEFGLKALLLAKDPNFKNIFLKALCTELYTLGFYESGLKFAEKLIEFDKDSLYYYQGLTAADISHGNYPSAFGNAMESIRWHPDDVWISWWFISLYLTREYDVAIKFLDKYMEMLEKQGTNIKPHYYFGYVYLKNGLHEKSVYHFEGDISKQLKFIEQKQPLPVCQGYLNLACIYSAMADKVKAVEYLRKAAQCREEYITIYPTMVTELKNHPMFEIIRDEPEFKELIKIAEDKWLPEKKKIEKLLQEYWSRE